MSQLTSTKLADYLRPQVTSGARVFPGKVPDMPNRVIGITMAPGPGLMLDGLFDSQGFLVTCRGAENNLPDAEEIANEVDNIFLGIAPGSKCLSFLMNNIYIDMIGRTGGAPAQLLMSDSLSRWTFTCSYYVQVATNIGQVFNG